MESVKPPEGAASPETFDLVAYQLVGMFSAFRRALIKELGDTALANTIAVQVLLKYLELLVRPSVDNPAKIYTDYELLTLLATSNKGRA